MGSAFSLETSLACAGNVSTLEALCVRTAGVSPFLTKFSTAREIKCVLDTLGFVVVRQALAHVVPEIDALSSCLSKSLVQQIDMDPTVVLDPACRFNRGPGRVSLAAWLRNAWSLPVYQWLLDNEVVGDILDAEYTSDYVFATAGGDACCPGTNTYQTLHNDWSSNRPNLATRGSPLDIPILSIIPVIGDGLHMSNGSPRIVPWAALDAFGLPPLQTSIDIISQKAITVEHEPPVFLYSSLEAEPGDLVLRDIRAPHGGRPNPSNRLRLMLAAEVYSRKTMLSLLNSSFWRNGTYSRPMQQSLPGAAWAMLPDARRWHADYIWNPCATQSDVACFKPSRC